METHQDTKEKIKLLQFKKQDTLFVKHLLETPNKIIKNYQKLNQDSVSCNNFGKKSMQQLSLIFNKKQQTRGLQIYVLQEISSYAEKLLSYVNNKSNATLAFMLIYGSISLIIRHIEKENNCLSSSLLLFECNKALQTLTTLGEEEKIIASSVPRHTLIYAMQNSSIQELLNYIDKLQPDLQNALTMINNAIASPKQGPNKCWPF